MSKRSAYVRFHSDILLFGAQTVSINLSQPKDAHLKLTKVSDGLLITNTKQNKVAWVPSTTIAAIVFDSIEEYAQISETSNRN